MLRKISLTSMKGLKNLENMCQMKLEMMWYWVLMIMSRAMLIIKFLLLLKLKQGIQKGPRGKLRKINPFWNPRKLPHTKMSLQARRKFLKKKEDVLIKKKSTGKGKEAVVPLNNISLYLEESVLKWKYFFYKRIAIER